MSKSLRKLRKIMILVNSFHSIVTKWNFPSNRRPAAQLQIEMILLIFLFSFFEKYTPRIYFVELRLKYQKLQGVCLCLCLSLCIKACVCGRNSGSSYEQQPLLLTFSFEPPPTSSSLLRWTPEEQSK